MSRLILLLILWGINSQAQEASTSLLFACNVQTEEIGVVEVFYTPENPAQITVKVNQNESINVSVKQWQAKRITLPSQKISEYQLIKTPQSWVLMQTSIDSLKYYLINCI